MNKLVNENDLIETIRSASHAKEIVLWGAARAAESIYVLLQRRGLSVSFLVDSNSQRQRDLFLGKEKIHSPSVLEGHSSEFFVIVASGTFFDEITQCLKKMGYRETCDYLNINIVKEYLQSPNGTPKHCPQIGHFFLLHGKGFRTCCGAYLKNCASTGNFERDIEQYYVFCEHLRDQLNEGKWTSCRDCSQLRDGRSEEPLKITRLNISSGLPGGDQCNAKCCYCNYSTSHREENVLELFQKAATQLDIENVVYAAGEITISPYRDEILEMWKEKCWSGMIATNAFIYCDGISALLRGGRVCLNVSLDAGTAETFAKIKGVDCFESVLKNLERYSLAGRVLLKYIVLQGINDNTTDVDGFVATAKRLGAKVQIKITRDFRVLRTPMTDNEYSTVVRLVDQCTTEGLACYYAEQLRNSIRWSGRDIPSLTADK